MTNVQFQALAQLLRLRGSKATDAARMVLVDGVSQADAARSTGLTPQAVHNAVKRAQTGLELAQTAVS